MPLEFTEYCLPKHIYGAMPQVPCGQEVETQVVVIGAGSVSSLAFNARTQMIVCSKVDVDCRIAIGPTPVADAAEPGMTRFLRAGSEYAFIVTPGEFLAVIAA